MEEKATLRRIVHQSIKQMTNRQLVDRAIHQRLFSSYIWKESQTIAVTSSLPLEIDTSPIIHEAFEAGKTVCVPKVTRQGLTFHIIHSVDDLEAGVMNILEPTTLPTTRPIDLCVVPGRVFDRAGYRIGWGGGYYDRFLKTYKGTTIALAYTNQLVSHVPTEPHDLPVEWIVTEKEMIQCSPYLL
ncbi:MAG: 5-formyltetrahydrofolate cyclo-ligase [Exiguobacterium marinum]|uniref:5-formyltetrahydrofolate cyclo-ligase n=1 Tax=Exiguobacterium marinum TaxID=273528 RepID=A0ABY7WYU0_9BACL|nr:5-formyltetrahydrofolate cyclo-ligase [Exiguobacterium marinum]WDH74866.1 5-formyltetrahydrofolate cyclo-ligase [Exiguobacterium marinum]